MVVTLDPAGPAQAAGILQGDIIVRLGGSAVTGLRSLYQQLGSDAVGKKMAVDLIRAGVHKTVDVTIAPRPQAGLVTFAPPTPPRLPIPDCPPRPSPPHAP